MSIVWLWLAVFLSIALIIRVEWELLKRGFPGLGLVVTLMYSLTYGLGWTLWRLDPSSIFGYGTVSTLGSLDRMGLLLALGLPSLVSSYSIVFTVFGLRPSKSLLDLSEQYRPLLQRLSFALVLLSMVAVLAMTATGVFLRDPQLQQQALQASWVAKFLVGTGILSRLAPVGLVLVPFAWSAWSRFQRMSVVVSLSAWTALVLASASRGQLLALPLYLFLGSVIWGRLRLKSAALFLLIGALLFLPVAEGIRVQREGDASNPALRRKFEAFQIGKQLIGTSHEFYLFLQPDDCRNDLELLIERDQTARRVYKKGVHKFPHDNPMRWHVVGRYAACSGRSLSMRRFENLSRLPLGLLPNSLGFLSPSLFDGQLLSESLSLSLDLKPGETSYSTLSLFADAWWRGRWLGVVVASVVFGVLLALIQSLLLLLMRSLPIGGLLGQLLVISLVGTWINNTTLTMMWFLLWDFPKSWLELIALSGLFSFRLPKRRGTN